MQNFTSVRESLTVWLLSLGWVKFLFPYHLYIAGGAVAYKFIYELIWRYTPISFSFLSTLDSIAYWAFIIGSLLTLISSNLKYLPYILWGYCFQILFPFASFYFSNLLTAVIYGLLGYFVFKYSALEDSTQQS